MSSQQTLSKHAQSKFSIQNLFSRSYFFLYNTLLIQHWIPKQVPAFDTEQKNTKKLNSLKIFFFFHQLKGNFKQT